MVEDSDMAANDAVGDAPAAVYVGALYDHVVLRLAFSNVDAFTDVGEPFYYGLFIDDGSPRFF